MVEMQPLHQRVLTYFGGEALGRIEALLFTSFGLDVRYFERSILPSFFPELGEGPASEPHRPLFEYLEETPVPISVMFDHDNFVGAGMPGEQPVSITKELRWQAHAVRGANNCFHSKLVLALVRREDGALGIVFSCASANLTKPGWSHNLEACVLQTIWLEKGVQSGVLVDLQSLLGYFRQLAPKSESGRLIAEAIEATRPYGFRRRKEQLNYRMRLWHPMVENNTTERASLAEFLRREVVHDDLTAGDWRLEVISPYYGNAPSEFFNWAVSQLGGDTHDGGGARVLCCCPQQDGKFAITAETAESHVALGDLAWASLAGEYTRSRLRDADGNLKTRTLHAKIYRFWKPEAEILVVGSANATVQGCGDGNSGNDEACLIFSRAAVDRKPMAAWLTPLESGPDEESCQSEAAPPEDQKSQERTPYVRATFDWEGNRLELQNRARTPVAFYLAGHREPLVVIDPEQEQGCVDPSIRDAMYQSPVLRVASAEDTEKRYLVLVEETSLQLKPPAPTMERRAEELIRDWQQGFDERLSDHVARADDTAFLSEKRSNANDLDDFEADRLNDVLLALWRFREDMQGLLKPEGDGPDEFALSRVRARVFGKGAMSVRNLVDKLFEPADEDDRQVFHFDSVERYLSMLGLVDAIDSLAGSLRAVGYRAEVRELKKELNADLGRARASVEEDLIKESSPYPPKALLDWVDNNFGSSATAVRR